MIKDFVSNFITDVCFVLGIDVPRVTQDFQDIYIDTRNDQFAGDVFFVSAIDDPNSEFLFCIAHDLRVRWQFQTNAEHYDFKLAEEIGLDNFDDQPAEVDAVAFATLYMLFYFQLLEKLVSLKPHTRELLKKRMEEVTQEVFF